MTPEMKKLYDAAVVADNACWEALVEQFAGDAAMARYDARGVSTSRLRDLHSNFRAASEVWLAAVRQHRTMLAAAGAESSERIILSVRFTAFPVNAFDPGPEIWVTFDDRNEKILISSYSGDLSFTESEFIGLTERQALQLVTERGPGHLRN